MECPLFLELFAWTLVEVVFRNFDRSGDVAIMDHRPKITVLSRQYGKTFLYRDY